METLATLSNKILNDELKINFAENSISYINPELESIPFNSNLFSHRLYLEIQHNADFNSINSYLSKNRDLKEVSLLTLTMYENDDYDGYDDNYDTYDEYTRKMEEGFSSIIKTLFQYNLNIEKLTFRRLYYNLNQLNVLLNSLGKFTKLDSIVIEELNLQCSDIQEQDILFNTFYSLQKLSILNMNFQSFEDLSPLAMKNFVDRFVDLDKQGVIKITFIDTEFFNKRLNKN